MTIQEYGAEIADMREVRDCECKDEHTDDCNEAEVDEFMEHYLS